LRMSFVQLRILIGGDTSDDWPFHAAASVMRAHSLLRSLPEVDAEHTAVTGISWGGYTTCLVASLDDRFKAAVPVYGCGFLHEGESVQKPSIDKLGDRKALWVKEYDPGSLLPRCRVPIFFVNGTNDIPLRARQLHEELQRRPWRETYPHSGQHAAWPSTRLGTAGDRSLHRLQMPRWQSTAHSRPAAHQR